MGGSGDGGYVLPILEDGFDCYISAGVGDEERFSAEVLTQWPNLNKTNSYAYDGTIEDFPWRFTTDITFFKKNIGGEDNDTLSTLKIHQEEHKDIFLSMDIEGGEWDWLPSQTKESLSRFKMIVIELHWLISTQDEVKLKNIEKCLAILTKGHTIVHAHGNNNCGWWDRLPDVLELTLLRNDQFATPPNLNNIPLPRGLDSPNSIHHRPDIDLNFPPWTHPDNRILHYLGTLATHTPTNRLRISPTEVLKDMCNQRLNTHKVQDVYKYIKRVLSGKIIITPTPENPPWLIEIYAIPLTEFITLSHSDLSAPIRFRFGDHTLLPDGQKTGTIMKAIRCEYDERPVILPFEYDRHWGNVPDAMTNMKPLASRRDVCVWRGANSGLPGDDPGSRARLVRRWDTDEARCNGIDIAFSRNVQGKTDSLRNPMTIKDMSDCKYIVSARGNDKDSGLNWKLACGSVVLMTKPHIESWLMESKLIDHVHYVRISDDWSDLEEKVEWCRANPTACEAIVTNARRFMSRFGTREEETSLAAEVMREYFERVY